MKNALPNWFGAPSVKVILPAAWLRMPRRTGSWPLTLAVGVPV